MYFYSYQCFICIFSLYFVCIILQNIKKKNITFITKFCFHYCFSMKLLKTSFGLAAWLCAWLCAWPCERHARNRPRGRHPAGHDSGTPTVSLHGFAGGFAKDPDYGF